MGNEQSQQGASKGGKLKGSQDRAVYNESVHKENVRWNESKVDLFVLPDEIKMGVLWHLSVIDLAMVCLVCKEFNRIGRYLSPIKR